MTDLLHLAAKRHSCKAFDPTKKISDADFATLKSLMRLAPSSVNLQPWKFFVATTDEAKARLVKTTAQNDAYNSPKILNASHVVLITHRTTMNRDYVKQVLDSEQAAGRFRSEKSYMERFEFVAGHVEKHAQIGDIAAWSKNQAFLCAGTLLLGAAELGIDAVPMEGFDREVMDKEMNLAAQGLDSTLIIPLGYRSDDDFNAELPKARLAEDEIFEEII